MKQSLLGLLSSAALVMAGCASGAPAPLTKIRLPMGYIANVQYAPFYIAVDRGYFQQEGIEIEFDYRFETDGMKLVGAGELPFAVASGEQVPLARAQGLPVVYIMQWWHTFPVGIVSLADKNIRTPNDLIGRQVGLPGFFGASYVGWRGLLYKAGIAESAIQTQDIGFTQVAAVQQGQVDAAVIYLNNEPIQLRAAGFEVNLMAVSDYVSIVSNGIVTNEQTIRDRPQLVHGFVRALLRGLKDALEDPEAAFTTSTRFVDGLGQNADTDAVQRQVLDESLKLWQTGTPGQTDPADWDEMQNVLISMGLLQDKIDAAQLFSNRFVDEVNR